MLNSSRLSLRNTALRVHIFSRLEDKTINHLTPKNICTWEMGRTGSNTSISKVCRVDGSSWKTVNQGMLNTMPAPVSKMVVQHVRECPGHQVCPRCAAVSPGQGLSTCGWFGSTAGGIRRQVYEPGARVVRRELRTRSRQRIGLSRIGRWRCLLSSM